MVRGSRDRVRYITEIPRTQASAEATLRASGRRISGAARTVLDAIGEVTEVEEVA